MNVNIPIVKEGVLLSAKWMSGTWHSAIFSVPHAVGSGPVSGKHLNLPKLPIISRAPSTYILMLYQVKPIEGVRGPGVYMDPKSSME